jgi:polyphosphate kinase
MAREPHDILTGEGPPVPHVDAQRARLDGSDLYMNRELSWLEFNQRVLDQALDETHPLLERVKFLSIVGSNLDEFFMVRVATLLRTHRTGRGYISPDGLTNAQQLGAIRARTKSMMNDQAACWNERLRPALAAQGIRFLEPEHFSDAARQFLAAYFRSEIFPLLTPLAFDPGHPFPLISNRSLNFAVVVRQGRRTKFARVKVPALLPRFIAIPRGAGGGSAPYTFAFLEDVMRMNLGELFPGVPVVDAHLFRVIRDTDMEVPDGADDLLETVDRSLKKLRHGPPSLLQVEAKMPGRVLSTLIENFEIKDDVVLRTQHRLNFADWMALHRLPLPQLKDTPFVPRTLWGTSHHATSIFDDVRNQDFLVHHPFDSFDAVHAFVEQAAQDPGVVGIKMTLYRIGRDSPLIDLLIEAADAGKQVAVLVELKARFDERNNIQWATRLEEAGVHVVYGLEKLKTHCKVCLVVRQEADGVKRYAHIGTGNYNRITAQIYTDVSLFTADSAVLDDVSEVFNALTGYSQQTNYRELLVAPANLRDRLRSLIEREGDHAHAGRQARIIIKNNAITDPDLIAALYRASQAGTEIDLIVRGVCCLCPGVPGVSERTRVRSVVGRFLEHSRLYYFENGGDPALYIGSADLMERNLDRRVETLCRIRDAGIARELRQVVLEAYLRDNERAYELIDGSYRRVAPASSGARVSAQRLLLDWYTQKATGPDDRLSSQ